MISFGDTFLASKIIQGLRRLYVPPQRHGAQVYTHPKLSTALVIVGLDLCLNAKPSTQLSRSGLSNPFKYMHATAAVALTGNTAAAFLERGLTSSMTMLF